MFRGGIMPLPRLVVCLAAGVCIRLWAGLALPFVGFLFLFVSGLSVAFLPSLSSSCSYTGRWRFGMLTSCLLILCGYFVAQEKDLSKHPFHFSKNEQGEGFLMLRLLHGVSEKQNSFQLTTRVDAMILEGKTIRTSGRLLVYLEKDSMAAGLRYGDIIMIENRYENTSMPLNPQQFDYKQYLARNNIFHTTYRQSGLWQVTGVNHGIFLLRWSHTIHARALQFFHHKALSEKDYAVISALLLGYREMLDDELRNAFAGAGAMHVLCVSGLHVGIIFLVLNTVFAFLNRVPGGTYVKPAVIVVLIWFYAAITGFSPSVMRAATMFSFVAAGQCLGRSGNIYNTLAASAFILLLADPFVITRIGFQLSYLAVLGIVSMQPWLYSRLVLPYKLPDKMWSVLTVSMAAQMATGPLSLYYFNQFPNYFLITNLIVIPLSACIIYVALLAFAFSWLSILSDIMLFVLSYFLTALHGSAGFIEALPYAVTSQVYITWFQTFLLFGLIMGGFFYFALKVRPAFLFLLLSGLLLTGSRASRAVMQNRQPQLVVYSIREGTAIDFFLGREGVTLLCSGLMDDTLSLRFNAGQHRISRAVPEPERLMLEKGSETKLNGTWVREGMFVRFFDKTLLIIGEEGSEQLQQITTEGLQAGFPVNFLIVGGNVRLRPDNMIHTFLPGMIILTAGTPPWVVRQWVEACDEAGIPAWVVREQGAFVFVMRQMSDETHEQSDQDWNEDCQHHSVIEGDHGEILSGSGCNNRQGGVHAGCSGRNDG
jgi:competence protein ComEC